MVDTKPSVWHAWWTRNRPLGSPHSFSLGLRHGLTNTILSLSFSLTLTLSFPLGLTLTLSLGVGYAYGPSTHIYPSLHLTALISSFLHFNLLHLSHRA